jgi:hypothetical protein
MQVSSSQQRYLKITKHEMSLRLLSRGCTRRYHSRGVRTHYALMHTSSNKTVFQLPPPAQGQEHVLQSILFPVLARTLTVLTVAAFPLPYWHGLYALSDDTADSYQLSQYYNGPSAKPFMIRFISARTKPKSRPTYRRYAPEAPSVVLSSHSHAKLSWTMQLQIVHWSKTIRSCRPGCCAT